MYKYVLNSAVKISMMFAKYFEYYTIVLGGGAFLWTCCILHYNLQKLLKTLSYLEFNVPFQHKYGYIRDERSQFIEDTVEPSVFLFSYPGLSPWSSCA